MVKGRKESAAWSSICWEGITSRRKETYCTPSEFPASAEGQSKARHQGPPRTASGSRNGTGQSPRYASPSPFRIPFVQSSSIPASLPDLLLVTPPLLSTLASRISCSSASSSSSECLASGEAGGGESVPSRAASLRSEEDEDEPRAAAAPLLLAEAFDRDFSPALVS